jgi:hypothetical membrane protein
LLWIAGAVQFVLAMVVVQLAWTTPYNLAENAISDLGAVSCRENPMGTSYVCSPLHVVFNVSIILFGVLVALGALAVRPSLPRGRVATVGAIILVVAGAGAILVGIFPEDTVGAAHALGALLAFVGSSIALILLGISMTRPSGWSGYRELSLAAGAISGGTIAASNISETWGPIGLGGLERLILAPAPIWLVVVGLRLFRSPAETVSGPIAGPSS